MKTSSIAVETSRSTTQSDYIVRQTNKRSSCLSNTTMNNQHIFNDIKYFNFRFSQSPGIQYPAPQLTSFLVGISTFDEFVGHFRDFDSHIATSIQLEGPHVIQKAWQTQPTPYDALSLSTSCKRTPPISGHLCLPRECPLTGGPNGQTTDFLVLQRKNVEWYSVHSKNGIAPKRTQIPAISSIPIPE